MGRTYPSPALVGGRIADLELGGMKTANKSNMH